MSVSGFMQKMIDMKGKGAQKHTISSLQIGQAS
jgi:hypothetical protein